MLGFFLVAAVLVCGAQSQGFVPPPGSTCDMMAIMPCLGHFMAYAASPEATAITQLHQEGRDMEITEAQILSLCQVAPGVTCFEGYVKRCVDPAMTDAHTLMRGTVKLMKACEQPDLGAKVKLLMTCANTLKTSPVIKTCQTSAHQRLNYLDGIHGNQTAGLAVLSSGRLGKDLCCAINEMKTCVAPELTKCTPESAAANNKFIERVLDAYECTDKIASGCGPVPALGVSFRAAA